MTTARTLLAALAVALIVACQTAAVLHLAGQ